MRKPQRISAIILVVGIGIPLLVLYLKNRSIDKRLADCGVYTVGKITRVYTLRGFVYAEYMYKIRGRTIKVDEGVNNYNSGLLTPIYVQKLKNMNYFFLKISCAEEDVHRIMRGINVPDTLQYIPPEGWKKIPSWAKNAYL